MQGGIFIEKMPPVFCAVPQRWRARGAAWKKTPEKMKRVPREGKYPFLVL